MVPSRRRSTEKRRALACRMSLGKFRPKAATGNSLSRTKAVYLEVCERNDSSAIALRMCCERWQSTASPRNLVDEGGRVGERVPEDFIPKHRVNLLALPES